MQSLKIGHLGFYIIDLAFIQNGSGCEFFPCGARSRFLPARSHGWREFLRDGVARDRQWTAARGREFLHDGVGRDRQQTVAHGGPVLAMESLANSIGCGRRCVEGRGVSVVIGGAYMARRKVWITRGTGRRVRSGFCQAVRGLAIMPSLPSYLPSYPKCKLQMRNRWIPYFCDFWQITRIQTPNAKPLEML